MVVIIDDDSLRIREEEQAKKEADRLRKEAEELAKKEAMIVTKRGKYMLFHNRSPTYPVYSIKQLHAAEWLACLHVSSIQFSGTCSLSFITRMLQGSLL